MGLVDRAKNIIVTPKTEWPVIAAEEPNVGAIITGYVLPLALIGAIASFIGYGVIGMTIPFVGTIRDISFGIGAAIQHILSAVISVLVGAAVIDALAPSFASQKNFGRAVQLVAYSMTVVWVAGIFNIFPLLGLLVLVAALYALYVMYLGFPHTMQTPQEKVIVYMVVSIIVMVVVSIIVGFILGLILTPLGLLPDYSV